MLLNNQLVIEKIKGEIKNTKRQKQKYNIPKSMGCSKSSSKREGHSNTGLPQDIRKILNKQSNFTPKGTRKRRKNKG